MSDTTIELLRDLIAIDSVNPSLVPGGAGEAGVADRVASELRSIGLDVEITEAAPGRPNVVGVLEGRLPGPALMFCGHLDTVGVEGMKSPFDPVQRDGRIYGRGSQDMKGGVAAMIGAARKLASSGRINRGRIIIAGVADEEYASIGADALAERMHAGGIHADAAVVTEPTDLIVAVGHKGFSWIEVLVQGRAAHGSRPSEGRDAITRMGRVLSRLEQLDRRLQSQPPHPILGTGSLHGSFITGGRELSTYPDKCVLQFERRTITGESGDTALTEAQTILEAIRSEDPEFEASARLMFSRPPYETPLNHALPFALEESLAELGKTARRSGMTFWTDAAVLGNAGTPSVVFGPGGYGLHSLEEYVIAEEVLVCQDALAKVAERFLES
ncbi:MAG TPA: M20/M25/M40 family metallo-hydrolase [Blastocatellia bacterium]|nr:M20/M25/M40 family metallo-hydrolase [Blastocatellia bacterium]